MIANLLLALLLVSSPAAVNVTASEPQGTSSMPGTIATPRSAAVPFSPPDQRSSGVPQNAKSGEIEASGGAKRHTSLPPDPILAEVGEASAANLEDPPAAPHTLDPRVGREGDIAHSGSRSHYVAIPLGPGIRIRVCGPAACIETTSTDAGPNRAMLLAGRIMDLDIGKFERVCGVPARYGLCPGSWVRITGPRMTLPPTDTGGEP